MAREFTNAAYDTGHGVLRGADSAGDHGARAWPHLRAARATAASHASRAHSLCAPQLDTIVSFVKPLVPVVVLIAVRPTRSKTAPRARPPHSTPRCATKRTNAHRARPRHKCKRARALPIRRRRARSRRAPVPPRARRASVPPRAEPLPHRSYAGDRRHRPEAPEVEGQEGCARCQGEGVAEGPPKPAAAATPKRAAKSPARAKSLCVGAQDAESEQAPRVGEEGQEVRRAHRRRAGRTAGHYHRNPCSDMGV